MLGAEHPNGATSLNNIGNAYRVRNGRHRPSLCRARSLSTRCSQAMGRHAEALRQHEEALRIRRAALGAEHPDLATVLNNIGTVYHVRAAAAPIVCVSAMRGR